MINQNEDSSLNVSLIKYHQSDILYQKKNWKLNANGEIKIPRLNSKTFQKLDISPEQKELHLELFNIITTYFNTPQLRIDDLCRLIKAQKLPIHEEFIVKLFNSCDKNKQFCFNRVSFLSMLSNKQANDLYENYAKKMVKDRLKSLRSINLESQLQKEMLSLPLSLFGLFFYLAQSICKNNLQYFASNSDNKLEERFDAITNIIKLFDINDQFQQQGGNLDQKLKNQQQDRKENKLKNLESQSKKLSSDCDQSIISSIFLKGGNTPQETQSSPIKSFNKLNLTNVSQINPPLSDRQEIQTFSDQIACNDLVDEDDLITEIDQLVSLAKIKGKADAFIDHINLPQINQKDFILSNDSVIKRNATTFQLKLPQIHHTFDNITGKIKKQYVINEMEQQNKQNNSISQLNSTYLINQSIQSISSNTKHIRLCTQVQNQHKLNHFADKLTQYQAHNTSELPQYNTNRTKQNLTLKVNNKKGVQYPNTETSRIQYLSKSYNSNAYIKNLSIAKKSSMQYLTRRNTQSNGYISINNENISNSKVSEIYINDQTAQNCSSKSIETYINSSKTYLNYSNANISHQKPIEVNMIYQN